MRALGTMGVAERDVVREIRRQLTKSRLFDEVASGVAPVTDAELRQAYDTRKPASPERRRLLNVVVDSETRAAEVLAKARAGTEFGALAVEYSRDDATRTTGGDLGDLASSQVEPPYAQAAFAAPAGELFGPVRTSHGWNVGKVVAVQAAVPLTFEEVGERLRAQLRTEREGQAWRGWLAEQVRAAEVDYADRFRPADPAAIPAG